MLAQQIPQPFDNDKWIYEIKWDGYRAIAEVKKGKVRLYSRYSNMFNRDYPVIVNELEKLDLDVVLDGEIVLLDEEGKPDFGRLQDYAQNTEYQLCYFVFDILYYNNETLCNKPLLERKEILRNLIKDTEVIKYTDHVSGQGVAFFEAIKEMNMEGIMAKDSTSLYLPGKRTSSWLKIKQHSSAEVVIAGFTEPTGARQHFGSLILAHPDENKIIYAGHVGTGFNDKTLKQVYSKLMPLIVSESPFDIKIPTKTPITWVKPEVMCEVKFSEITKAGIMRHPVFVSLIDKTPVMKANTTSNSQSAKSADEKILTLDKIEVKVTHFNKVYFPDEHITKGMVVDYYLQMADLMMPYLKDRPQSLKRNPNGIKDKGFFHKDAGDEAPQWVESRKIYSESNDKDIDYIICNNKATLVYMNNLGCIEINPWHSRTSNLENPDYLIIDLDPSEKNTFQQVVETALAVKQVLDKAGATGYCKTSGATGLHIYIPLGAQYSYENAKDFAALICMLTHELVPEFTSLERSLSKRGNDKIYLDHLQNRKGQTIATVYSVRPQPGATVSTPLEWSEVNKKLNPTDFNIFTVPNRVKTKGDLFKGILEQPVDIAKSLDLLGAEV
jgi:bifunctional non-homologous end joining protein LigD